MIDMTKVYGKGASGGWGQSRGWGTYGSRAANYGANPYSQTINANVDPNASSEIWTTGGGSGGAYGGGGGGADINGGYGGYKSIYDMPGFDPNYRPPGWGYVNTDQGGGPGQILNPDGSGGTGQAGGMMNMMMPALWGDAAAGYQSMLGQRTANPAIWDLIEKYGGDILATGAPVDTSGIYDANKAVANRYLQEHAADLAEQMGVGGLRFSTPLQSGITRETERMGENLAAMQAQAEIAAQEAAQGRRLGVMNPLLSLGQGQAGLSEAGMNRDLGIYGAMTNLGGMQAQLPMDLAALMGGLGGQQMQQQQAQLQGQYTNPYLQQAMQWGQGAPYGIPQTYQPSGFQNALGGAAAMAPYWGNLFGRQNPYGGYLPNSRNMGGVTEAYRNPSNPYYY